MILTNNNLYQQVFNEAVEAMIISDGNNGRIVDTNKACSDLLGYSKKELIGQKLSLLLDEESIINMPDNIRDIKMFGDVLANRKVTSKNGEYIPVDMTINTFENNNFHFILTTFRDISERIKYEKNILEINNQLAESNAGKDKLLSIIAHDLKNPLNALIGFSELYSDEENEIPLEEVKSFARTINEISKSSFNLLENLLNWARLKTNNITAEKETIDLFALCNHIINFYQQPAKIKNITIINNITPKVTVEADRNMLNTIIRNLVCNSIKFTPKNKQIIIKWFLDNSIHNIIVQDEGIGMDKKLLNDLFKPGIKVSRKGTNSESGTGFGLLLCKEFAQLNDGDIIVESEINKGSKFIVQLPAN